METSQITLYHGLTFLAVATGIIVILIGGFLVKLLVDLSKLTKNIDKTTTIIRAEVEPTLLELNNTLKSINSIAKNADEQVGSLGKLFESVLGAGLIAVTQAKKLSGGLFKGLAKGLVVATKLFLKK